LGILKIAIENIPNHDLLCADFPCQPFSIAGKQHGFKDERANAFYIILEILEVYKPSIILLENVENLVSHDNGDTFRMIFMRLMTIDKKLLLHLLLSLLMVAARLVTIL